LRDGSGFNSSGLCWRAFGGATFIWITFATIAALARDASMTEAMSFRET